MLGTTTTRRCALLVMLLGFARIAQAAPAADADLQLRYVAPATSFNEALPLGNGRMGVMVFGADTPPRPDVASKFSLQRVARCGAASSTRAGVTVV